MQTKPNWELNYYLFKKQVDDLINLFLKQLITVISESHQLVAKIYDTIKTRSLRQVKYTHSCFSYLVGG